MSTLKVSAINNAAAGSGGLVLAADGNVSGAGMDLIVSQSFTAASAVNVNNCFTSTYSNYKVVLKASGTAAQADVQFRLRTASTDSTTGYYSNGRYIYSGGPADYNSANTGFFAVLTLASASGGAAQGTVEVYDPASAVYTGMSVMNHGAVSGGTDYAAFATGQHRAATAYDGFSLTPASGTITGTLRVYGYRN